MHRLDRGPRSIDLGARVARGADTGIELRDAECAGQEALTMLCQIAREQRLTTLPRDLHTIVKDQDGRPLFTASVSLRFDRYP